MIHTAGDKQLAERDEVLCPTLARVASYIAADPALSLLARGVVRANGAPITPSGLDALACCVARSLLGDRPGAALAVPRGVTGLPAMAGLYLAMMRWALPHLHGSVLVATAQRSLSGQLRNLTIEGVPFERMRAGRLVSRPRPGVTGGHRARQAMMRPLDRGALVGLSQDDGFLLFAPLGSIPTPPASGVLSYAVVDTVASSRPAPGQYADFSGPDAWSSAYRAVESTGAQTLWLGELGDMAFEAFCEARGIPLLRLGWPLIAQAAKLAPFGSGGHLLSTRGLCVRAAAPEPIGVCVVHDSERDERAREVYMLLGKMRRRARGGPLPEPVRAAYKLLGLSSRLACTAEAYERAASLGSPVFNVSADMLHEQVCRAGSSQFRGRWKDAYRRYWDSVIGAIKAIWRLAQEEPAKLLALFDEIADAQSSGRELVVLCQTQTERRALVETLEELGATEGVTVATFARPAPAGGSGEPRRTLLLAPPPPWQTPVLLSGESGDTIGLCYPFEEPKLSEALDAAHRTFCDDRVNEPASQQLSLGSARPENDWEPVVALGLRHLDAFGENEEGGYESASEPLPDPNDNELWRELVDLWGSDIEAVGQSPSGEDPNVEAAYGGSARIIHFVSAPPVALRDDREVDVLRGEDIVSRLPGELKPGDHIAFLPGTERHSLRDALISAWDETLVTERALCEPLWRAAISQAVERHGIPDLARICERHEATVSNWAEDQSAPQQPEPFQAVLEASGNEDAFSARSTIWRFLQTTRTTHRIIGKKLRAAIAESLSDATDQPAVRDLEKLTRAPIGDLLDVAEELVIEQVGPARAVPLADCGHFLDPEIPLPDEGALTP